MVQVAGPPRGHELEAKRAALRRREILAAASSVFRRRGFHGAGMREIATELGIAVGKLYYWFESKHDLLAFCQETCLRALLARASEVAGRADRPDQHLFLLAVAHFRCLHVDIPGSLAHLEIESLDEPERSRLLELRRRYEEAIRATITRGQRSGLFVAGDPAVQASALLGMLNWSVKWFREDGRLPLASVAEALANQIVRGLHLHPEAFLPPDASWLETAPELPDVL